MNAEDSPSTDFGPEQLTRWYHEYGRAVRGYVLASVKREDVADDLLQEVFRRAWEARQRYQETGLAKAYLLRIADRLCCDWARRYGRERSMEQEHWEKHVSDSTRDPIATAVLSEDQIRLREALNELSALQQRVLLLRYFGDLSFAEIAETVGCPLNTALSHARRALLALRKKLVEVP